MKNNSTSIRESRSINVSLDINSPSRIAGYVPTSKSIALSNRIFTGLLNESNTRAFSISAPYGSGKSSAALMWALAVEHGTKNLSQFRPILESFRQETAENFFDKFSRKRCQGYATVLQGFHRSITGDLLDAIANAANRVGDQATAKKAKNTERNLTSFLEFLSELEHTHQKSRNCMLIVWDEFGKVLEHCAATGDSKGLLEIQSIAEFCCRTSENFPIVLTLVLHQSFSQYAIQLPNHVRVEWAKIEGRFEQINYIEDSKEIYQLIAQLINRNFGKPISDRNKFKTLAKDSQKSGFFKDFTLSELEDILYQAAPLSPVSLYLLPRISARVAQNERTLFTFIFSDEARALNSYKNADWITPAHLFDFFSDLMANDNGIGGTYRQWVETQMALKKASGETEQNIIKDLAAIRLGVGQSSIHANLDLLSIAGGQKESLNAIKKSIEPLITKKVVFYKKLTDEFSIWHGSDVDIRSAVQELRGRLIESIDLCEFLTSEFSLPYRIPQRYNDQNLITRFFDGIYLSPKDIESQFDAFGENQSLTNADGRMIYVVCENKSEIQTAREIAKKIKNSKTVFAIPSTPLSLRESVAELKAYYLLMNDNDFMGSDPVVAQEIKYLADESRAFIQRQVDRLVDPAKNGPTYFWEGKETSDLNSVGDLKRFLSKAMQKVFSKTPKFNNELINRGEPSAQIINARKKLIRAMLAENGKEHLSLIGYGPEVSIYRATILNNGLYKKGSDKSWSFVRKTNDLDENLSDIWGLLIEFWEKPASASKDLLLLINSIRSAPYGVRQGMIPLLLAASYCASKSTKNILEDGIFLRSVSDETFERMARSPRAYKVQIPELKSEIKTFVNEISNIFSNKTLFDDPIQNAIASMVTWAHSLPPVASERGVHNTLIDSFFEELKSAMDPLKFLETDLIRVFGTDNRKTITTKLKEIKEICENTEADLVNSCRNHLITLTDSDKKGKLASNLKEWKMMLPGDMGAYLSDRMVGGFLTRIEQAYNSEADLVLSLAAHITGKSLRFWDRKGLFEFELQATQLVRKIEDIADSQILASSNSTAAVSIPWAEKRLKGQLASLIQKVGVENTQQIIKNILKEFN